jgi:nucleoside-diphosphate-sugar epimerase
MAISLFWKTHLQSASPVNGLEFIKYPPVVNNEKLKQELGFKYQYSSREALAAFAEFYQRGRGKARVLS